MSRTGLTEPGRVVLLDALAVRAGPGEVGGIRAAFPSGERAAFYRGILARTDPVLSQITYGTSTNTRLNAAREALQQIKLAAALGLPRGRAGAQEPAGTTSPTPASKAA